MTPSLCIYLHPLIVGYFLHEIMPCHAHMQFIFEAIDAIPNVAKL